MIEYTYVAKNKDGEVQKGSVEASSESAAAKVLMSRDLYPTDIAIKEKSSFSGLFQHVSVKDKALLVRQLATTVNAGLPVAQALDTISSQVTQKATREILIQVTRDVESGTPLSVSFSRYPQLFSRIDITLLSAGETSGTLDKALLRIADSLEKEYNLNKKIQNAMIYPAFVLVIVVAVVALMSIYVMPKMADLYQGFNASLPWLTIVMINFSNFIAKAYLYIALIFVAIFFALRVYIKTDNGRYVFDSIKLKTPILGKFFKNIYADRFTRTAAGLVGAGVSIVDTLNITADAIGNVVMRDEVLAATEKVKSGIPLSTPLKASENFPPIVSQFIRVGEQTGELDEMLTKLADYYDEEVDNFVKAISSIIEPVIIVVLGLTVGIMMLAIMMPIYNIGKIIHV